MANAIIDTLKAKNTSGEEVIIYPRTTFDAVRDDEGKTLKEVLIENTDDFEMRITTLENTATSLSSILSEETF